MVKPRKPDTPSVSEPCEILTMKALNRALLARQMLLERSALPAPEVIGNLVGLQAQAPHSPYFALWTRIEGFRQEDLTRLIESRQSVRIALMRSTIHLVSAEDAIRLRPHVEPVLERGLMGNYGKKLAELDLNYIAEAGRTLVETEPLTLKDLGLKLSMQWHGRDPEALAMVIRNKVPLVQIPPRGLWGKSGQAVYTTAEAWLGNEAREPAPMDSIVLRYLAAFGPATVKDIQTWSGLTKLKTVVDRLRPVLAVFHDEAGHELFDLPDAPRPSADTPSPPRFLGEFDQMLLSYADRSRVMSEADRTKVFTNNGIIRSVILVDGFVHGLWKLSESKTKTVLDIAPFRQLDARQLEALKEEGSKLLQFAAPERHDTEIRFADVREDDSGSNSVN
ncbi:winged helix DNA-binding domain-containing protein [Paenibacillus chibensis]|uniref:winged helix DNA-binding domain-containing protein n=1 Tax=Paenibacillus chibensis TaxID=59846 RepID=UPI001FE9C9FA|nr:winged helix DNA-binding domain-containing protein [Paenibacillus chibensis]MEC0371594.1 winged helix DNA-binding domain-containing protein [Paenibacillus chibensis]